MKKLVIIGAGGHGRVVADIARLNHYQDICFLDDDSNNLFSDGKVQDFDNCIGKCDFFIAIGDNTVREKIFTLIFDKGGNIVSLIHPSATIAENVKFGKGVAVMAGAVVNSGVEICDGCIINTASSVDHDCKIDRFVHISVGAHLAGSVNIGKRTFVCAGVTVINNICIAGDCVIGAGAVVIEDIREKGTYIGVPAKKLKKQCRTTGGTSPER